MLGLLTSIPRNVLGADDGEEMHANAAAVPLNRHPRLVGNSGRPVTPKPLKHGVD